MGTHAWCLALLILGCAGARARDPARAPRHAGAVAERPEADRSWIPSGEDWWCYVTTYAGVSGTTCHRERADCEAERDPGDGFVEGATTSACARHDEAACYVRVLDEAAAATFCFATAGECDDAAAGEASSTRCGLYE